MDKFEYKLKLDELKSLTAEGKYQEAAEIADSINWHKIKNVYDLIKAGEIYENVGRYEESREILLMAYDRTPIGRTIIYRLAELAVKMGRFDEAEDYYQEFVNIAPHDNLRYVLRYEISKASGADIHTLIEILEELKTQEYSEEWAFELVTLYQQAGMEEKCIDACDELILWFGEGDYVERALEVKKSYGMLTEPQAEKYRRIQQKKGLVTDELYGMAAAENNEAGASAAHFAASKKVQVNRRQPVDNSSVRAFGQGTEPERESGFARLAEGRKTYSDFGQSVGNREKQAVPSQSVIEKEVQPGFVQPAEERRTRPGYMESAERRRVQTGFGQPVGSDRVAGAGTDSQRVRTAGERPAYEKEGIVEVRPGEILESGEIVNNTVKIPKVKLSPDRFNTQSLQDIVKFGMRTITGATREDDISTGMAMIKQAVEEVPNMRITETLPKIEMPEVSAAEVYAETHPDYSRMLAEDPQGQFSFVVPEQRMIERQITGQISIGDLLEEWEHAQEEARQRNLKVAKEQAIRDVVDIMSQLSEVLPVLDSGVTPQELLQQYQEGDVVEDEKAAAFVVQMNHLLQQQMEEISHDTIGMQEEDPYVQRVQRGKNPYARGLQFEEPSYTQGIQSGENPNLQESQPEESPNLQGSQPEESPNLQGSQPEENSYMQGNQPLEMPYSAEAFGADMFPGKQAGEKDVLTGQVQLSMEDDRDNLPLSEEMTPEKPIEDIAPVRPGRQQTKIFPQVEEEELDETGGSADHQMEKAILREAMKSMEAMNATAPTQKIPKVNQSDRFQPIKELSKEQREVFTYFVSIKGMESQICQAINGIGSRLTAKQSAATGNLMIRGGSGSGKTVLATAMVRALQQLLNLPAGKVGKIEASVLNQRDIAALIGKVAGGCLIIEKAGDISVKTANELAALLTGDESGLVLIVEDTHKGIEKFLSLNPALASCFTERINIPAFTSDELVVFAKSYANELGYKIDELGVLALYNSISNIQKLDHATTLTEVKDIVDGAIRHVEKGGVKKLFSIITSQRYDDEDYVILREKDFGF